MKISWIDSGGGSMGPNTLLKLGDKYVGHFYSDASYGVKVDQVLEDIEVRYNLHDDIIAALENARDRLRDEGLFTFQEDAVLALARGEK